MIASFFVSLEIVFLIVVARRFRQITPFHVVIGYCIASQLVYINAEALGFDAASEIVRLYAILDHPNLGIFAYFLIALVTFLASLGLAIPLSSEASSDVLSTVPSASLSRITVALFSIVLIHVLLIDKSALLFNTTYLFLNSRDARVHWVSEGIFGIVQSALPFAGLISAAISVYALGRSRGTVVMANIFIAAYTFLFYQRVPPDSPLYWWQ